MKVVELGVTIKIVNTLNVCKFPSDAVGIMQHRTFHLGSIQSKHIVQLKNNNNSTSYLKLEVEYIL